MQSVCYLNLVFILQKPNKYFELKEEQWDFLAIQIMLKPVTSSNQGCVLSAPQVTLKEVKFKMNEILLKFNFSWDWVESMVFSFDPRFENHQLFRVSWCTPSIRYHSLCFKCPWTWFISNDSTITSSGYTGKKSESSRTGHFPRTTRRSYKTTRRRLKRMRRCFGSKLGGRWMRIVDFTTKFIRRTTIGSSLERSGEKEW